MSQYFEENNELKNEQKELKIVFKDKTYKIYTNNGVFSKDKLDYGTRLLLETITTKNLEGNILDLGCGYGIIGLIIATTYPQTTVDMTDITNRALELARQNTKNLKNVNIYKSDIYKDITNKYNQQLLQFSGRV